MRGCKPAEQFRFSLHDYLTNCAGTVDADETVGETRKRKTSQRVIENASSADFAQDQVAISEALHREVTKQLLELTENQFVWEGAKDKPPNPTIIIICGIA